MPTHIPVKIPAKMAFKIPAKRLKNACKGTLKVLAKMPQNARKSNCGINCLSFLE